MGKIKKYRIESQFSEELEFEITRITKTTQEISTREEVDDNGNLISPRSKKTLYSNFNIEEEITAVSLPSRTPAKVIVLEEECGFGNNKEEKPTLSEPPTRPQHINITKQMNAAQEARVAKANDKISAIGIGGDNFDKPIVVPKNSEITWADNEGE